MKTHIFYKDEIEQSLKTREPIKALCGFANTIKSVEPNMNIVCKHCENAWKKLAINNGVIIYRFSGLYTIE